MSGISVYGQAAGASGSAWRKILAYANVAIGSYVLNNTNFSGLGAYLPCRALLSLSGDSGATVKVQVSNDNGTTWFDLVATAVAGQAGIYLPLDTASTIRIDVSGGTADILIFVGD